VSIYNDIKEKIFTTKSNKSKIYKKWTFKNKLRFNNNKTKGKNVVYSNMVTSLTAENINL